MQRDSLREDLLNALLPFAVRYQAEHTPTFLQPAENHQVLTSTSRFSAALESDFMLSDTNEHLNLQDFAPEILENIFTLVGTADASGVAACAATCRLFQEIIYQNPDKALWRAIHQGLYDDPGTGVYILSQCVPEIDWQAEVINRYRVQQICTDSYTAPTGITDADIDLISRTLLTMWFEVAPDETARNAQKLQRALASSAFWEVYLRYMQTRSRRPARHASTSTQEITQLSNETLNRIAQLNLLHGWNTPEAERRMLDRAKVRHGGGPGSAAVQMAHSDYRWIMGQHRKTVYNAGNFDDWNDWGPFNDDGNVDWSMIDSIASLMQLNVNEVREHSYAELPGPLGWASSDSWRLAKIPTELGVRGCVGKPLTGLSEAELLDWADISGTWRGTYAFMDYQDWVRYNFQPMTINIEQYSEAVGNYMTMQLQCGRNPNSLPERDDVVSSLPHSDLLPVLHFHGVNHYAAHHRITSQIRGSVCLTNDNPPQVRWTWVVGMAGEDRWRLTGIQVGGRGSKRGIIGIWSAVQREQLTPNGPFWYFPEQSPAPRPEDAIRQFDTEMRIEIARMASTAGETGNSDEEDGEVSDISG